MRYVSAYLLCALSGKEPQSSDIERVLGAVGIEIDNDKVQKVVKELKGKNLEELIASGRGKLASMPVGGAAVASAAGAPAAAAAEPAAEKKEEKKVEKEESESDDDMGFGLFD